MSDLHCNCIKNFKSCIAQNKNLINLKKDDLAMYFSYGRSIILEYKSLIDMIQMFSDKEVDDSKLIKLNELYIDLLQEFFNFLNEFLNELFNLIKWNYFLFIILFQT